MTEKGITKRQFHISLSEKNADPALIAHMEALAGQGVLTEKITVALTLLAQLENGNRQLLDEKFPGVCEMTPEPPQPPPQTPTPTNEDVLREIAALRQDLKKGGVSGYVPPMGNNFPLMQPANQSGPKPIGGGIAIELPKIDIEDDDSLAFAQATNQVDVTAMMARTFEMMSGMEH